MHIVRASTIVAAAALDEAALEELELDPPHAASPEAMPR